MQIMFEKPYSTYSGRITQMCFMQFLEHDLHSLVYKYSVYICNETE